MTPPAPPIASHAYQSGEPDPNAPTAWLFEGPQDAAPAAPLYDAETPPVGLFALRDAVRCLRETGSYTDDEGEATNALEDLLDRLSPNAKGRGNG